MSCILALTGLGFYTNTKLKRAGNISFRKDNGIFIDKYYSDVDPLISKEDMLLIKQSTLMEDIVGTALLKYDLAIIPEELKDKLDKRDSITSSTAGAAASAGTGVGAGAGTSDETPHFALRSKLYKTL